MNLTQRLIADAGGPTAIANALGIRPWAVNKWGRAKNGDGQVPAERVRQVVDLANAALGIMKWSPRDVRPDVFV